MHPKKNLTPGRSSLTPSKLDQSDDSVTNVLSNKTTVFGGKGKFRSMIETRIFGQHP